MAELDWHAERSDLSGIALLDRAPESEGIDLKAVRLYRLGRVRTEMKRCRIDALILSDPINIRYATGTRNMQVFSMRNTPARYLLLTANRSILYEFTGCLHLADGFEIVDEVRPSRAAIFVAAGPVISDRERKWGREMGRTIREFAGRNARVGLERLNAGVALALRHEGFTITDAQNPVEMARAIKSPEELKCVNASLRATEIGVGKLRDSIRPGLTETELWSVLHKSVIEQNGDYCETRLLNAGTRTNPWFQETAHNIIRENELIALDTDVVGCHGYYSDFSRTFHAGPGRPTPEQRTLYQTALEQVYRNMEIIRPGMTFRDYADRAWNIPDRYYANRYYLSAHGCGMTGEYPYLYHHGDFPDAGYDGVIEPGMTLCVESYIGDEGGTEGVKLEQQVLVTETGIELLSRFPFEEALMDKVFHAPFPLPTIAAGQRCSDACPELPDMNRVIEIAVEEIASTVKAVATTPWLSAPLVQYVPETQAGQTDILLVGAGISKHQLMQNAAAAQAQGLAGLIVSPGHLETVMGSLGAGPLRPGILVGLPGQGGTPQSTAFAIRQALRQGAGSVDIVLDAQSVRDDDVDALRRSMSVLMDAARTGRVIKRIVVDPTGLDDMQQVIAARIAAHFRPDEIAAGLIHGGAADLARTVALIREVAGSRIPIRAPLNLPASIGADRTGLIGALV